VLVVIVEVCEAGSGGQKVDGGGRCEPDGQREAANAQAALSLSLALPGGSELPPTDARLHSKERLDAQICSLPYANPESR
jgi:hypothetical protein